MIIYEWKDEYIFEYLKYLKKTKFDVASIMIDKFFDISLWDFFKQNSRKSLLISIYDITDKGDEELYPHIREIAEDMVTFMYDQGGECTDEELDKFFTEKYQLEDADTVKLLTFFMCDKLGHFGWEASKYYSTEKGWFRRLESLGDDEE